MSDQERRPNEAQQEQAKEQQALHSSDEDKARKEAEDKQKANARQAMVERFNCVSHGMDKGLGANPHFQRDKHLSVAENRALELIWRVKIGKDGQGTPAAAMVRKQLLNTALATLQPVLSVALDPELKNQLLGSYNRVQNGVKALRQELATATLMEMHSGRSTSKAAAAVEQADGDDSREDKLAKMGNLAYELAQLGKRKKKQRFPYDPDDNPVGVALAAIEEQTATIVALATRLARAADKLDKAESEASRKKLTKEIDALGEELIAAVLAILARCSPDYAGADSIAAYPSLLAHFGPIADKYAELTTVDQALTASLEIVAAADACADDVDDIVAAEKPKP